MKDGKRDSVNNASLATGSASSGRRSPNMHRLHKLAGIVAAAWLAVLGITGFFLDHRDWRWMWQETVPEFFVPRDMAEKAEEGVASLYRVVAENPAHRIAAGKRGMWTSDDGGASWTESVFHGKGGMPQVFAIVEDTAVNGGALWLGTDDGVWFSADGGKNFEPHALRGMYVNALETGGGGKNLLAVVDRSAVHRISMADGSIAERLELFPVSHGELPDSFDLSRFTHDLHFGRGLFSGLASLLINDFGGVAMLVLPITGVLFWWLPKRWKRKKEAGVDVDRKTRKRSMKWLLESHATYIGLLSVIPVVYLSVTGILLDHRGSLMKWLRSVKVERQWLPPTYDMGSWDSQICTIAGYPEDGGAFSLGTRGGLYTTRDGGVTWKREDLPGATGYVWMMRRIGNSIVIGGMGSPNYVKEGNSGWREMKGVGHMPSDVTLSPSGNRVWKSHMGLMEEVPGAMEKREESMPRAGGVPLFYVLDGLHSGLIIHPQWIWVNDAVSVLALFLTVTGLFRWWKIKKGSLASYDPGKLLDVVRLRRRNAPSPEPAKKVPAREMGGAEG